MKRYIVFFFYRYWAVTIIVLLIIFTSCTRYSPSEKDLKKNMDRILKLDMFETVQQGNTFISFNEFRRQYEYISVVYLEDGCSPCYPKFIEWHNKMDSISPPNNYTVLFVIKGDSYDRFMAEVWGIDENIEEHFYASIARNFKFLDNNGSIPKWIIDNSILIDPENKIKMVGAPWLTGEMTQLFFKICEGEEL